MLLFADLEDGGDNGLEAEEREDLEIVSCTFSCKPLDCDKSCVMQKSSVNCNR